MPKGFSFFTATFKDTTSATLDIQKITSVQTNGAAWKTSGSGNTKCAGAISIQKIGTNGAYLDVYSYYSMKPTQGWYDSTGSAYISKGTVTFEPDEGFVVNNTHTIGARLVLPNPVAAE